MLEIPFMKLHGAENDFLFTWREETPSADLAAIAQSMCARTTGIGADGWMQVWPEGAGLGTRLFNSDGSEAEMSGNGTRCAAAFGIAKNAISAPEICVRTGAGQKVLRLLRHEGSHFLFEMRMGVPKVQKLRTAIRLLESDFDATTLDVGNPQCAIFVANFPDDWRTAAREAECAFGGIDLSPAPMGGESIARALEGAGHRALRLLDRHRRPGGKLAGELEELEEEFHAEEARGGDPAIIEGVEQRPKVSPR